MLFPRRGVLSGSGIVLASQTPIVAYPQGAYVSYPIERMTRDNLQFLRRGRTVSLDCFQSRGTVLDWLRLQERSTGTKEGCAEGDCGACAVVVARERDGRIVYEPVNSCITLLGQLDGAELITVEDLAEDGKLHPVQAAMARQHGSQCGFCTPGIVMSLFAHFHECNGVTDRSKINDALAGNLCRCTGYRPIVDAALEVCTNAAADRFARSASERLNALRAIDDQADLFVGDATSFLLHQRVKHRWRSSAHNILMPRSSPARPTSDCGSPRSLRRSKRSFMSAES